MNREAKYELNKMQSLMERMDGHLTKFEADKINESIEELLDARGREDMTTQEFLDFVNKTNNKYFRSTIGYISAANLGSPTTQIINPVTKRKNTVIDWDAFGQAVNVKDKIIGVVKFARYTFNFRSNEGMSKHYWNEYVPKANAIRSKYGIAAIQHQPPKPQQTPPAQPSLSDMSFRQNVGGPGCYSVSEYFLIGENGKVIKKIDSNEIYPFLKGHSTTGVSDLKKLQASDDTIKAYCKEIAALNFKDRHFKASSIVYVITSIGGKKKRYFNPDIKKEIDGVPIDGAFFKDYAERMYLIDKENAPSDLGEYDDV